MVEWKLEELLSDKNMLSKDIRHKYLNKRARRLTKTISYVRKAFSEQPYMIKYLKNYNPDLHILINQMIDLSIVYAYYFCADYLFRNESAPTPFNAEFINSGLDLNDTIKDNRANSIYQSMRSQVTKFHQTVLKQKDPQHMSPSLTMADKQNTADCKHFYPNVISYFQKIFIFDDMTTPNTAIQQKKPTQQPEAKHPKNNILLLDLLPSFSLRCFSNYTNLPFGSHVKNGKLDINKLCILSNFFNRTHNIYKKDDTLDFAKEDFKVSYPCKFPELLYQLVQEDLFHMNRMDYVIKQYFKNLKKWNTEFSTLKKRSRKQIQKDMITMFFSLSYFCPSVVFQEYCNTHIQKACEAYFKDNDIENAIEWCKPIFRQNNILFPQILIATLYFLFTDEEFNLYPKEYLSNLFFKIEEYIFNHKMQIEKHFTAPDMYIWNDPEYCICTKESKGNNRTYQKWVLYNIPNNELDFEDITAQLVSTDPTWRSANLSLRNRNDGRPLFLNTCAEFIFRGACNALNFPPGNITERNGFLESLLCMEMKKALESNTKKEYVNTIFI